MHERRRAVAGRAGGGARALLAGRARAAGSGAPAQRWATRLVVLAGLILGEHAAVGGAIPLAMSRTADGLHWTVEVEVGSPARTFNLVVDTASSEMIMFEGTSTCLTIKTLSSNVAQRGSIDLLIDGEQVSDDGRSLIGVDVARFRNGSEGSPMQRVRFSIVSDVVVASSAAPTLHTLSYTDGWLGLAYEALAAISCGGDQAFDADCTPFQLMADRAADLANTSQLALRGDSRVFAIDPDPIAPKLWIGGLPATFAGALSWSDPNWYRERGDFHRFTLHRLDVCGVSLLPTFANTWDAVVDSGSSCLLLPSELFDIVAAWVRLDCDEFGDSQLAISCLLPSNWTLQTPLPSLAFQVQRNGTVLTLPLADLVLPPAGPDGRHRLCMHRDLSIMSTTQPGKVLKRPVVFGSTALIPFLSAFNMSSRTVGFANQVAAGGPDPDVNCRAPVRCQGQQTHLVVLNRCVDPDCSEYLSRVFDEASAQCVWSRPAVATIYTTVGLLFAAEIVLLVQYRSIRLKLIQSVPSL